MRLLVCTMIGLCLVILASAVSTGTTSNPGGQLIIYHGVLLDANGNPVGPGYCEVTFRIFADPVGGQWLWAETRLVEAKFGGVIWETLGPISNSILLGTPTGDSAIADRYLELQPSWSGPVSPRVEIQWVAGGAIPSVNGATAVPIDTTGDTIRLIDTADADFNSVKVIKVENRELSKRIDSLRKIIELNRPLR